MLYQFTHTTAAGAASTQYTIYASEDRPEVIQNLTLSTYSNVVGGKNLTLYIYNSETLAKTSLILDRRLTAYVTNGQSYHASMYFWFTNVMEIHVGTDAGYFAAPDDIRCTIFTEEKYDFRKRGVLGVPALRRRE